MIHPRDNDLVIGTHGRSIYVANVENLQKISSSDSLLNKDLFLFNLKPINYSENWGKISADEKYDPVKSEEYSIPFYVKKAGDITFSLLTNRRFVLKKWNKTAHEGINEAIWDLAIDPAFVFDYEMSLNGQRKSSAPVIKLEKADDGKIYMKPGVYTLLMETAEGKKIEKEIEIKAVERKSKRAE